MASSRISAGEWLRRFIEFCSEYSSVDKVELQRRCDEACSAPAEDRAALAVALFKAAGDLVKRAKRQGDQHYWQLLDYDGLADHASPIAQLGARLLRGRLPLSPSDLTAMVAACVKLKVVATWSMVHIPPLVRYIERRWEDMEDHHELRQQLELLADNALRFSNAPENKLGLKIERMLCARDEVPLDAGEAWSDRARADIASLAPAEQAAWIAMLKHCRDASSGKPSRKWSKTAADRCDTIGATALTERLLDWFPLVDRPRTAELPRQDWRAEPVVNDLILDHHADVLKGLCWIAGTIPDAKLARALCALAISCYRKVPGIGPRAVKIGNAAVYALGQTPGRDSLGQLAMLCVKVKFGTAQKLLDKALDAAAEREGLPRDEIEEMAVPAYGLTEVGLLKMELAEHTAELSIKGTTGASSTRLSWVNPKSKRVKSVPTVVKRECPDDLKDLKAAAKDIQKMLPAQRDRIDSLFLERKTWAYATWRERYLGHPLVGTLARRLIWVFDDGLTQRSGAWLAQRDGDPPHGPGALVDVEGQPLTIDEENVTVSLWHPIDPETSPGSTDTREDVLAWRMFFEERQICQPFKQAHREVYLLTDAERGTEVYSNRFAGHILRQHQFSALCSQRRWKNRLRLMVDDEYPPAHRLITAWDIRAEFWIEGVGDDYVDEYVLESGAFRYLATDQVRFYSIGAAENRVHASGGPYETRGLDEMDNHPLCLDHIPPIVLSEVFRDVDLFVGVSSVGNNPEWVDGGPEGVFRDYWHSYSFGDLSGTAQSRRELLQRLVPRLSIATAATVTDKFLVVLGKKRTYKIHLGSGNILMEPNDEYLCIVPGGRMEAGPDGGKPLLPFEGDRTLAIILSKAFMLANDDQITDRTITAQISVRD